jgi:hypothetical protein
VLVGFLTRIFKLSYLVFFLISVSGFGCSGDTGGSDDGSIDGGDGFYDGAVDGDGVKDGYNSFPCGDYNYDSGDDPVTNCDIVEIPEGSELIDDAAVKGYIDIYDSSHHPTPASDVSDCDVHVIWFDIDSHSLVYKKSNDLGSTWHTERNLLTDDRIDFGQTIVHRIAAINNYVYLMWTMGEPKRMFFMSSPDRGETWSDLKDIGPCSRGSRLSLGADESGLIGILVVDASSADIWLYKSENHGVTWHEPAKICELPFGSVFYEIDFRIHRNSMHALLSTFRELGTTATFEASYMKSIDCGGSWTTPFSISGERDIRVIESDMGGGLTSMDIAENRVDVTWTEPRLPDDRSNELLIYYRRSVDLGDNWNAIVKVNPTADGSGRPFWTDLSSSGSMVHITSNLGYFRSMDGGETWSSKYPQRSGRSVHNSAGWVVITSSDLEGQYWIRFREGQ